MNFHFFKKLRVVMKGISLVVIYLMSPNPSLAGSWDAQQLSREGFPKELQYRDFYIRENPFTDSSNTSKKNIQSFSIVEPTLEDCRQKISQVICLVNSPKKGEDERQRPCLNTASDSTTKVYAALFEQLFDHYPPPLQKLFCSVERIFIEKDFLGTAYAAGLTDSKGEFSGAIIGIRQSVLDEKLTLSKWASWKEQLSMGGVKDSYQLTPGLPMVHTSTTNQQVNDFLYFVISHELGHILDFSHKLNKLENCSIPKNPNEIAVCNFTPESWGAISWKNREQPKDINEFPLRRDLCFYDCEKAISKADINTLYSDLWKTTFISGYAATNPYDDFADSFAYYLMSKYLLDFSYIIDTNQGMFFDPIFKLHSVSCLEKYNYIKNFLSGIE